MAKDKPTIFQEAYVVDITSDGHMTPLGGRVCGWQIVEDGYANRSDIKDMKVGDTIELPFPHLGDYGLASIQRIK